MVPESSSASTKENAAISCGIVCLDERTTIVIMPIAISTAGWGGEDFQRPLSCINLDRNSASLTLSSHYWIW